MRGPWTLMAPLTLLALLSTACGPDARPPDNPGYEVAVLMLPEGDAGAGREAFLRLGCVACHAVAWDDDLPAPTSPNPGPELGVHPVQPGPGGVAASITAPSHKVPPMYQTANGGSPMPDYTQLLTVRQLADLITYLRRQGLETQARTAAGQ